MGRKQFFLGEYQHFSILANLIIYKDLWNRGGGRKVPPLEMCYLGPNQAISFIKLILANQSHGTMISYTTDLTIYIYDFIAKIYKKYGVWTKPVYWNLEAKKTPKILKNVAAAVPFLNYNNVFWLYVIFNL